MIAPPRIVLVDDDPSVGPLVTGLLTHAMGLPSPRLCRSIDEARKYFQQDTADLLLLDIRLKARETGLQLLADLRAGHHTVRVMILTMFGDEGTIREAWRLGIEGYVQKPIDPAQFVGAVWAILKGQVWFCPEAQAVIFRRLPSQEIGSSPAEAHAAQELSDTQRGILVCLAAGLASNGEIAAELHCAEPTVANEITRLSGRWLAPGEDARPPRVRLAAWAKNQLQALTWRPISLPVDPAHPDAAPHLNCAAVLSRYGQTMS